MKKQLINEVKQLQKIAGLLKENTKEEYLKEYIESDPRTITQAFKEAKVDLTKPCVVVDDQGRVDRFNTAQEILTDMENDRKSMEDENPTMNDEEGINYELANKDIKQGQGELMGDDNDATEGLTFKLAVSFSDAAMKEIWQ